jgi:thiol:disulfide interchange protein
MARHERMLWAALVVLVVSVQWPALKGFYYRAADVAPPPSSIKWRTDLASALLEAQRTDKAVLVDFSADWCPPYIVMKHDVWPDDAVENTVSQSFLRSATHRCLS